MLTSTNLLSRIIKKKRHKKPKTKTRNKRQETKEDPIEQDELEEDTGGFNLKTSAPSNTYGVQPLGNLYFNRGSINSRNTGLVIKGSKKWILFPPDVVPPGVYPSPDGAEVACPVSIMEWFMNFYGATRNLKRRPIECICKAGEVIFVPNGWWHLVINLEESIAITQNYVSRRNLLNVLDFLKRPNAGELVSGTRDRVNLHDKFENAVESTFPGTIDQLVQKAEEKKAQEKKLSFWDSVTDSHAGAFKFSF